MKTFKKVFLKDVAVYREASLPLDRVGITQILGNNKDSKSGGDTNAVGKSLLLRPISEVIFNSSPLTQNIKQRAKMDLLTHSSSHYGIEVNDGRDNFSFIKKAQGKTFKYQVLQNGEDVKIARKDYAEQKINSVLDFSEEEFYTTVFVDSGKPSLLQIGTPTQRISFFTSLFRLDDLDNVRKTFNAKLSECKKAVAVLSELKEQSKEITPLSSKDIETLKSELKGLKNKSNKTIKAFEVLSNERADLSASLSNKEAYLKYKSYKEKYTIENVKAVKAEVKNYEKQLGVSQQWDTYNSNKKEYEERFDKLNTELQALHKKTPILIKHIDSTLETTLNRLNKYIEEASSVTKEPEFDTKELRKLSKEKLPSLKKVEQTTEQYKGDLAVCLNQIKSLTKVTGESCPTCQQPVEKASLKALMQKLEKEASSVKKKLSKLETLEEKVLTFQSLKEKYVKYKEAHKEYKKQAASAKKRESEIPKLKEKVEHLRKAQKVNNKLEALRKPKKPKGEAKERISSAEYKDKLNFLSLHSTLTPFLETLESVCFKTADKDLKKLSAKVDQLSETLTKLTNKISALATKIENSENERKKDKKLRQRIQELETVVSDMPVIEGIIAAYSNKGIKLLIIKQIAKMLEKNMNKYAPLLYSEKTEFVYQVEDDRNFNILVKRKVNGRETLSDVRTLSGAERRAFSFLIPLSILPLIPHERRVNIMVLDEPMVNMGEARRELFVESFIPRLAQIVPHLIIISTEKEEYKNAHVYTVTKNKGTSTLKRESSLH